MIVIYHFIQRIIVKFFSDVELQLYYVHVHTKLNTTLHINAG